MNKVYYIYTHIRLDKNEIFYVGIGTNITSNTNQNHYKRSKSRYRRSVLWNNIVNKTDYKIEIVFETCILQEVYDKEIELIKKYGRIIAGTGTLSNISTGGEGNHGFKPSKEHINKVILAAKGRKDTEEVILKKSLSQKGKYVSKETGIKISQSKKGKNLGVKIPSESKRVRYKPSGEVFKSITQAAKKFNYRRNTLGRLINANQLPDFELISDDLYFKITNKRNWKNERINRTSRKNS